MFCYYILDRIITGVYRSGQYSVHILRIIFLSVAICIPNNKKNGIGEDPVLIIYLFVLFIYIFVIIIIICIIFILFINFIICVLIISVTYPLVFAKILTPSELNLQL